MEHTTICCTEPAFEPAGNRHKPRYNRYVTKAQNYIAHNLDKALTLEEVSSRIYISKAYLSELFPTFTGQSFTAYVSGCRMQLAAQLLVSTSLPIQDIGQTCGFDSPAYFSTVFSRQYGMSPRKYRTSMLRSMAQ